MRLVVDTNRIIAALIRDSLCRRILLDSAFCFITPDFSLSKIGRYEGLILKKSGISKTALDISKDLLYENIEVIPKKNNAKKIPPKAGNMNAFLSGLPLHITCSFGSRIFLKADTDLSLLFKLYFYSLKIFQKLKSFFQFVLFSSSEKALFLTLLNISFLNV